MHNGIKFILICLCQQLVSLVRGFTLNISLPLPLLPSFSRDKQATNSGSGPEFFGYSNPTILNLLQKMSDAKKCPKYKFVRFAEPSRRGGGHKIHSGGGQRQNPKSKALLQKVRGKKGAIPAKKKFADLGASKGNVVMPQVDSRSAIAPVLGTGLEQYGMDIGALSDSSLDDSSSATDTELIIDS